MEWETVTGPNDNLTRFLDFIKKAEGGATNRIVGGGTFADFSDHPRIVGLRTKEGPSTAAGDYQITATTYDDVAPKIGVRGFDDKAQRQIAIELIRRNGALEDVMAGNFEPAINKLGKVWASFPSSPYSQPKRDWNFVKANLSGNPTAKDNEGWEVIVPAASSGAQTGSNDGWEVVVPATVAGPQSAPAAPKQTAQAAPAPSPAPQRTTEESVRRGLSLGTRDVLEGAEKAFTYPVRAASDFAAGLVGLAGGGDSRAYKVLTDMGLRGRGAGALAADAAGLAKPETKTEKTVSAGIQAAAGLTPGTVLSRLTEKAPQAVQSAMSVLMPSTGGSAGQVAKDAAVFGGLGAGLEAAPAETAAGLAVLAAGKAGTDKVLTNRAAAKMIEKAGSTEAARINAEVAKDFAKVAGNPNLRALDDAGLPTIATSMRNQQASRYIDDVTEAIKRVEPTLLKKYDVATLLKPDRIVGPDELALIRAEGKNGEILADAIGKYQRAIALTAPTPASGSVGAKLARAGIEWAPVAAGTALGGPMGTLATIMAPKLLSGTAQRLTGKKTVPEVIERLSSGRNLKAAEEVLRRLGPSEASLGTRRLADAARQAEREAVTEKLAQEAADRAQLGNLMGIRREARVEKRLAEDALAKQKASDAAIKAAAADESNLIKMGEEARAAREAQMRLMGVSPTGVANTVKTDKLPRAETPDPIKMARAAQDRQAAELAMAQQAEQRALMVGSTGGVGSGVTKGPKVSPFTERDKAALAKLDEVLPSDFVGAGPLGATMKRFSDEYGLTPTQTKEAITKLRDSVSDDTVKGYLNSLLNNTDTPALLKLQDRIIDAQLRGTQSGGALSAATKDLDANRKVIKAKRAYDNAAGATQSRYARELSRVEKMEGISDETRQQLTAAIETLAVSSPRQADDVIPAVQGLLSGATGKELEKANSILEPLIKNFLKNKPK